MKKLYIIGNHKMNLTRAELEPFLKGLSKESKKTDNVVGVAVSSPYLYLAEKYLKKTSILYGSQNCHFEKKGAYTGEVSVDMLRDFGGRISIVGHSERRAYDNETNEKINLKIKALLRSNVKPIFCFGETKDERDNDLTKKVIKTQLESCLIDLTRDEVKKLIFAYEPVWAIGTGESATSKQAEDVCRYVKQYICKMFELTEGEIVLLYGGSLNPTNAVELLSKTHIDGGLIGGASLKLDAFEKLINLKIEE
jgi:triosephosphate isomerase